MPGLFIFLPAICFAVSVHYFPRGYRQPQGRGRGRTNLLFGQNFLKTACKWRKLGCSLLNYMGPIIPSGLYSILRDCYTCLEPYLTAGMPECSVCSSKGDVFSGWGTCLIESNVSISRLFEEFTTSIVHFLIKSLQKIDLSQYILFAWWDHSFFPLKMKHSKIESYIFMCIFVDPQRWLLWNVFLSWQSFFFIS